jgi:hypothetical protein
MVSERCRISCAAGFGRDGIERSGDVFGDPDSSALKVVLTARKKETCGERPPSSRAPRRSTARLIGRQGDRATRTAFMPNWAGPAGGLAIVMSRAG